MRRWGGEGLETMAEFPTTSSEGGLEVGRSKRNARKADHETANSYGKNNRQFRYLLLNIRCDQAEWRSHLRHEAGDDSFDHFSRSHGYFEYCKSINELKLAGGKDTFSLSTRYRSFQRTRSYTYILT